MYILNINICGNDVSVWELINASINLLNYLNNSSDNLLFTTSKFHLFVIIFALHHWIDCFYFVRLVIVYSTRSIPRSSRFILLLYIPIVIQIQVYVNHARCVKCNQPTFTIQYKYFPLFWFVLFSILSPSISLHFFFPFLLFTFFRTV